MAPESGAGSSSSLESKRLWKLGRSSSSSLESANLLERGTALAFVFDPLERPKTPVRGGLLFRKDGVLVE
jgi:hypothetical protein